MSLFHLVVHLAFFCFSIVKQISDPYAYFATMSLIVVSTFISTSVLSVRPRELRLAIQHHEAAMMTISCSSFIVYQFVYLVHHKFLAPFPGKETVNRYSSKPVLQLTSLFYRLYNLSNKCGDSGTLPIT